MKQVQLASGLKVTGMDRARAEILEYQTADYFRHGITVEDAHTVVDVGANFGLFALSVLTRTKGRGRIVCVEAAPQIASFLKENLALNFPEAQTSVIIKALSSEAGECTFYYRPSAPERSSLLQKNFDVSLSFANVSKTDEYRNSPYAKFLPPWLFQTMPQLVERLLKWTSQRNEAKRVPVVTELITLDQLMTQEQLGVIDLLKIDVEGAELEVLNGLSHENARTIRQIVIEVHDIDGRVETIRERFLRWGFDNIATDQELIFQGSNVFNMYARRSAET